MAAPDPRIDPTALSAPFLLDKGEFRPRRQNPAVPDWHIPNDRSWAGERLGELSKS
jgi:hypothetical protein